MDEPYAHNYFIIEQRLDQVPALRTYDLSNLFDRYDTFVKKAHQVANSFGLGPDQSFDAIGERFRLICDDESLRILGHKPNKMFNPIRELFRYLREDETLLYFLRIINLDIYFGFYTLIELPNDDIRIAENFDNILSFVATYPKGKIVFEKRKLEKFINFIERTCVPEDDSPEKSNINTLNSMKKDIQKNFELTQMVFELFKKNKNDLKNETENYNIPPGVKIKKCEHCNREFSTDRDNKKYCSDSCSASARSKRSRNNKIRNSSPEITRTIKNYG